MVNDMEKLLQEYPQKERNAPTEEDPYRKEHTGEIDWDQIEIPDVGTEPSSKCIPNLIAAPCTVENAGPALAWHVRSISSQTP